MKEKEMDFSRINLEDKESIVEYKQVEQDSKVKFMKYLGKLVSEKINNQK